MTLKGDAKFWEKSTCRFKTDMRNLTNYDPEHSKVFRPTYTMLELKKYRGVMFDSTED